MPGMAELEVKEQSPAETNPIEHLGEYIHPPRLDPRTIGHKTRTIGPYRPRGPRNTSCHGGPTGRAATISPRQMEEPRPCWNRLSIPPDYFRPTCQQEQTMRTILLSAATVL